MAQAASYRSAGKLEDRVNYALSKKEPMAEKPMGKREALEKFKSYVRGLADDLDVKITEERFTPASAFRTGTKWMKDAYKAGKYGQAALWAYSTLTNQMVPYVDYECDTGKGGRPLKEVKVGEPGHVLNPLAEIVNHATMLFAKNYVESHEWSHVYQTLLTEKARKEGKCTDVKGYLDSAFVDAEKNAPRHALTGEERKEMEKYMEKSIARFEGMKGGAGGKEKPMEYKR